MAAATPMVSFAPGPPAAQRPPQKPRRSTLVRRREEDDDSIPSSPSKRSKVSFDSDVEVRMFGENELPPELVQEEVASAFQRRAVGDNSGYEKIKDVFTADTEENNNSGPETLRCYSAALLRHIPSLDRSARDLVQAIVRSEWLGRADDYVSLFSKLIANIVTAHASFAENVLSMLVDNLKSSPPSNTRLVGEPPVQKSTIFARAQKTIRYLLRLIPSASASFRTILSHAFPHHTDSVRAHVIFVKNLLAILKYQQDLRFDILTLITERLVKIDVQVQVDIDELEEDLDESLIHNLPRGNVDLIAEQDNDSDSSDEETDSGDEEGDDQELQNIRRVKKNVEKMDWMLDILFSYYDRHCNATKDSIGRGGIIEILISHFDTVILPTHRSRHTQFLLFHYMQSSVDDIDQFVGICVSKVVDKRQAASIRQNAAAYLASFVARGQKVSPNIVRMVFDYISSELERLRKEYEPTCRGPDVRRYSIYYCLVQTLLYIFCFRWRDMELRSNDGEDDEDDLDVSYTQGHQWKVGVKETFPIHVFSKLNPLKVCSPTIVNEFARVARQLGVVYVYHLLETNKRIRLWQPRAVTGGSERETALSLKEDESHAYLDAYFPFDPYRLPRSRRWIEGDYREWTSIPGLDEGEANSSDSEEEGIDGSDVEDGTETDMTGISQ